MVEESVLELLPFWKELKPDERELVRLHSSIKLSPRGELIHGGEHDCLGFTYVLDGLARAYLLSEEGREITLFRLGRGECCVLSASCVMSQITFDTFMSAERDTRLLIVGSGAVGEIAERNIYLRCFLYEQATARFSDVMWALQNLLFRRYDQRLAHFLVEEYERSGGAELRMTQEQLAQNTSSAREVAARMLKRFSAEGLVDVSRRGVIKLLDAGGLKKIFAE